MILLLLIMAVVYPPAWPHAPNATWGRGQPYYRYQPGDIIEREPEWAAAVQAFVAATDATWRGDFTDAEMEQWQRVRTAVYNIERIRK